MEIMVWIVLQALGIWIQGFLGVWASDIGSKKGYDPIWSGINGVRFGIFAIIAYLLSEDKTKNINNKN